MGSSHWASACFCEVDIATNNRCLERSHGARHILGHFPRRVPPPLFVNAHLGKNSTLESLHAAFFNLVTSMMGSSWDPRSSSMAMRSMWQMECYQSPKVLKLRLIGSQVCVLSVCCTCFHKPHRLLLVSTLASNHWDYAGRTGMGLAFRVWFRVEGLGFRVWGLGFGFWV